MDLLRINDACHVTGLSRKTIYRYMDKGILEYQEIDGKRHIQLKDLKKIQRKKQTDPKRDTVSDTKSEIKDLKDEIKSLKNSILQLTECLETVTRTLISDTNNFVYRHKKDTKKNAIT
ncbi:helix-turn-helix transcriptional regulator, partial [Vibrio parahaemolyticus]